MQLILIQCSSAQPQKSKIKIVNWSIIDWESFKDRKSGRGQWTTDDEEAWEKIFQGPGVAFKQFRPLFLVGGDKEGTGSLGQCPT